MDVILTDLKMPGIDGIELIKLGAGSIRYALLVTSFFSLLAADRFVLAARKLVQDLEPAGGSDRAGSDAT